MFDSRMTAVLEKLTPATPAVPAIGTREIEARLEKARALTRDLGADALLIGPGASLAYFSRLVWGLSERLTALFLPVTGKPLLICPYFEQGTVNAGLKIEAELRPWHEEECPFALIGSAMRDLGLSKLAVDPALPFAMAHRLGHATGLSLEEASPVIKACRSRKSPAEIAILAEAMAMTLRVEKAVPQILHEGISTSDVAAFIEAAHKKLGSPGSSFVIVQFGRGTAFPHGLPGVQHLKENDLVLVDTGCWLHGYTSDLTRTYCFGKPTDEERRIWDIEKEAQAAAFAKAGIGVPCEEVDAAARAVLVRYGLGPDYRLPGLPHRTGHGLGMDVHEDPYIVRGNKTPLDVGMCFSDEPMIVVPDRFGIRLEDDIYITESGPKFFTEPQSDILTV
ncbi:Xaa-Pro peptidase family protein [Rhizomicrobium electricum]|uniref:Xaa-Pro peptidase family protein n=2 Tax=Rhizomicrobium electricum TaxID=480070 RepID=A0ABN1EJ54_9PROT|nr:Xaa-Pro dipeptidase [Rhizomicrobium electricum]